MNSITHTTTQTSFPCFVSHRLAERPPTHVRNIYRSPPAAMSTSRVTVDKKIGGGKGMSWFHEIEQEVREYELDQFGVVNNAVYSSYSEYGVYKLLDAIGFDAHIKLAVTEASAKYIAPLRRKDKYVLKLRIYDYSTTRLFFESHIVKLPNHEPIVRGTATLVRLDDELRPCRIPASTMSKFHQFLLTHAKKN